MVPAVSSPSAGPAPATSEATSTCLDSMPASKPPSDAGPRGDGSTPAPEPKKFEMPPAGVPIEDGPRFGSKLWRIIVGRPKDLAEKGIFHALSLIPFLAWVGLGADGLSSSSYGPEEAFKNLGQHTYLAVGIALAMVVTVAIISAAYSRIIEAFPHGGGGYLVATKLLGERAGVVSGSALLVDYVLTITVSIAAAGDALFSFIPPQWTFAKLPIEVVLIVLLTALNIRGVKESVMVLMPIFLLFLATHAVLIFGAFAMSAPRAVEVARHSAAGFKSGLAVLGLVGMVKLFVHAYSLGGGTYTGLEAVSNGLPIMREPRVQTGKRTMVYMAVSLAVTAGGLLVCYLLLGAHPVAGKTMNAVLLERFVGVGSFGRTFTVVTLVAEGALLVVGAQAGFVDGPRVMANMAVDSWMPHRLAALSERLTTQNGIVLMGGASLVALLYTGGDVGHLVVMYSINVFLTFSLSMFGMLRHSPRSQGTQEKGSPRAIFAVGFLLCVTILCVTVLEKFLEGGWITLLVTAVLVGLCFFIRRHYRSVAEHFKALDATLKDVPTTGPAATGELKKTAPTAVVLVAAYSGVGVHTLLNIFKAFPGYFKNVIFVSVGVIDSGGFKGEGEIEALKQRTEETLAKYVDLANRLGMLAGSRSHIGTDAVADAEELCLEVGREFPRSTFFAGQVIFQRERWYDRWLHNQTAFAIQKRLQWAGMTMVILPVRVR